MARGERVAPPRRSRCPCSARRDAARSPTTAARSCWSTSGRRGASRASTSCRCSRRRTRCSSARGGTVLGIDAKENSGAALAAVERVRPHVPEPARPRRRLRPQVGPDRLSETFVIDREGASPRCAASRSRRSGSTRRCRRCSTRRPDALARCSPPCSLLALLAGAAAAATPRDLAARRRGRGDVRRVRHRAERLQLRRGRPGARVHPPADRRGQDASRRSRTALVAEYGPRVLAEPAGRRLRRRRLARARSLAALAARARRRWSRARWRRRGRGGRRARRRRPRARSRRRAAAGRRAAPRSTGEQRRRHHGLRRVRGRLRVVHLPLRAAARPRLPVARSPASRIAEIRDGERKLLAVLLPAIDLLPARSRSCSSRSG